MFISEDICSDGLKKIWRFIGNSVKLTPFLFGGANTSLNALKKVR